MPAPVGGAAFMEEMNFSFPDGHLNSAADQWPPSWGTHNGDPSAWNLNGDDWLDYDNSWDELRSVVEQAAHHHHSNAFDSK